MINYLKARILRSCKMTLLFRKFFFYLKWNRFMNDKVLYEKILITL